MLKSGLIAFVFLAGATTLSAQEKYALIIGITEYPNLRDSSEAKLKYPARDAEDFSVYIGTPQGGSFKPANIHLVTDRAATRENLYREFGWLQRNAGLNALVYVFFAGHGIQYNNQSYFLPNETSMATIPAVGIPMEEFFKNVTHDLSARQVVVFIDACHSAGAAKGVRDPIGSVPPDIQQSWKISNESESKDNQLAMGFFSSMANQESFEDDNLGGGHGLFTYYLLQGLRGEARVTDGFITGGSLFDYVRENVQDRSRRYFQRVQTPTVTPDFSSRFRLAYASPLNTRTGPRGRSTTTQDRNEHPAVTVSGTLLGPQQGQQASSTPSRNLGRDLKYLATMADSSRLIELRQDLDRAFTPSVWKSRFVIIDAAGCLVAEHDLRRHYDNVGPGIVGPSVACYFDTLSFDQLANTAKSVLPDLRWDCGLNGLYLVTSFCYGRDKKVHNDGPENCCDLAIRVVIENYLEDEKKRQYIYFFNRK